MAILSGPVVQSTTQKSACSPARTAPGGTEAVAFELRDEQAYGKLHDLTAFEVAPTATPGELMEVRVVRHADAIFDAVDFATMRDADASWQILRNLTTQLHFEVSG